MNESSLLQQIYRSSASSDEFVLIGPGDDMALLSFGWDNLLCGVDQLIIGRHVSKDTSPELIGRKAIARCFSDIAAMGGTPVGSLMTAALPPETDDTWAMAVFESASMVAGQWGGPIIGGDIATSEKGTPPIFTVTAFGTMHTTAIKRHNAQVGDVIYVTGTIGNSIESHHLTFIPRITEAKTLIDTIEINTMIDISDGLGQDASHLATDRAQLVIDTSLIPLREGATLPNALSDGEDYELLFTSAMKPPKDLTTAIGFVQQREANQSPVITTDGEDISHCGWTHG